MADRSVERMVRDLLPGDRVGLASFPGIERTVDQDTLEMLDLEWAVVEAVVVETADCACVYNGAMNFALSPKAMVAVDPDQTETERQGNLAEYLKHWTPGDYAGPPGRELYAGD